MAKAQNITTENNNSVAAFLNRVADETKKQDSFKLVEIIEKQSGFTAKMWGTAIIGFGTYHYVYESGREGDMCIVGFSPRKDAIALYFSLGDKREELLEKFGKHKTGKGCIYIKKLDDINLPVFKKMIDVTMKKFKK